MKSTKGAATTRARASNSVSRIAKKKLPVHPSERSCSTRPGASSLSQNKASKQVGVGRSTGVSGSLPHSPYPSLTAKLALSPRGSPEIPPNVPLRTWRALTASLKPKPAKPLIPSSPLPRRCLSARRAPSQSPPRSSPPNPKRPPTQAAPPSPFSVDAFMRRLEESGYGGDALGFDRVREASLRDRLVASEAGRRKATAAHQEVTKQLVQVTKERDVLLRQLREVRVREGRLVVKVEEAQEESRNVAGEFVTLRQCFAQEANEWKERASALESQKDELAERLARLTQSMQTQRNVAGEKEKQHAALTHKLRSSEAALRKAANEDAVASRNAVSEAERTVVALRTERDLWVSRHDAVVRSLSVMREGVERDLRDLQRRARQLETLCTRKLQLSRHEERELRDLCEDVKKQTGTGRAKPSQSPRRPLSTPRGHRLHTQGDRREKSVSASASHQGPFDLQFALASLRRDIDRLTEAKGLRDLPSSLSQAVLPTAEEDKGLQPDKTTLPTEGTHPPITHPDFVALLSHLQSAQEHDSPSAHVGTAAAALPYRPAPSHPPPPSPAKKGKTPPHRPTTLSGRGRITGPVTGTRLRPPPRSSHSSHQHQKTEPGLTSPPLPEVPRLTPSDGLPLYASQGGYGEAVLPGGEETHAPPLPVLAGDGAVPPTANPADNEMEKGVKPTLLQPPLAGNGREEKTAAVNQGESAAAQGKSAPMQSVQPPAMQSTAKQPGESWQGRVQLRGRVQIHPQNTAKGAAEADALPSRVPGGSGSTRLVESLAEEACARAVAASVSLLAAEQQAQGKETEAGDGLSLSVQKS
uniref:Uncharacterized protein n=1 Tax=Chromera velia CCMP2878 TaxID=1169474 RepID=A0A0G4G573_9ALVE|eukprot:Cvel_20235.t1-p1 / transcript=Cvel_20235.t1 / gene=Cvel_20235 / organism=Chromera_velia_CCMP2878 / gene_product=hypothetical protein / transcript_product=hypothetical protein / location=Cvel_scaffold1803:7441-11407(+) / protein_length=812 / sequence_SO=supercontig / SO=protein_coding / is_pseudo=false